MRVLVIKALTDERAYQEIEQTFRVGFPTAELHVVDNIMGLSHHAFIEANYAVDARPLVFLDPDVIFYDNVEEKLKAYDDCLLAGRQIPNYWNPVVEANEVRRFHTSLLYMPKPQVLHKLLREIESTKNYPFEPFAPFIYYLNGIKFFYDTTAQLYHYLNPNLRKEFSSDLLDCYTHIGCSSMLSLIQQRAPGGSRLLDLHSIAKQSPEKLKYFWKEQDLYYSTLKPRL